MPQWAHLSAYRRAPPVSSAASRSPTPSSPVAAHDDRVLDDGTVVSLSGCRMQDGMKYLGRRPRHTHVDVIQRRLQALLVCVFAAASACDPRPAEPNSNLESNDAGPDVVVDAGAGVDAGGIVPVDCDGVACGAGEQCILRIPLRAGLEHLASDERICAPIVEPGETCGVQPSLTFYSTGIVRTAACTPGYDCSLDPSRLRDGPPICRPDCRLDPSVCSDGEGCSDIFPGCYPVTPENEDCGWSDARFRVFTACADGFACLSDESQSSGRCRQRCQPDVVNGGCPPSAQCATFVSEQVCTTFQSDPPPCAQNCYNGCFGSFVECPDGLVCNLGDNHTCITECQSDDDCPGDLGCGFGVWRGCRDRIDRYQDCKRENEEERLVIEVDPQDETSQKPCEVGWECLHPENSLGRLCLQPCSAQGATCDDRILEDGTVVSQVCLNGICKTE